MQRKGQIDVSEFWPVLQGSNAPGRIFMIRRSLFKLIANDNLNKCVNRCNSIVVRLPERTSFCSPSWTCQETSNAAVETSLILPI